MIARRVVAFALLVAVGAAIWLLLALFGGLGGDGQGSVAVRVAPGATVGEIGDLLERRGVVSSALFFELRARIEGRSADLLAGDYLLAEGMSYGAALERLAAGPPPREVSRITIPEGRSRRETAALVRRLGLRGDYARASVRSAGFDPRRYGAPRETPTLEGFLFPATYELERGAVARELVAKQLASFRERFADVSLARARRARLTPYDVLVIASMVEREAQLPRERPLIAAVIYNRLRGGIPLGIDATIRYSLGNWERPLRVSELARDTPYNTRLHAGLPPTPIGNPGLASIEAAARPARVPYLYYVVKPDTCGEHAFSSTAAQFERDVARYNAARAARGGASPTACPG